MPHAKVKRSSPSIVGELARAKRLAVRETAKIETELNAALETVEQYMREHPRQTAAITLSLGAALGAAGTLFLKRKSKRQRKG